ncbi:MAG: SGNH/GDSL hydrolase family protein, partial [Capsulimonadales bacterium]|nr:SGNH/GDSL hydrolase family protein [Capsulimonadales bacterium]
MRIQENSKLVFIGDSITDCGRARPVGEGLGESLGRGYVALIDALLGSTYPGRRIRVVNVGTSGNTVRDLANRWQTDVLDLKPDWLSVMIGINDVWRQYDSPLRPEIAVLPGEYEQTYRRILDTVRPSLQGLVLMTPFYIETNREDAMRATMDVYGGIVRALASEYDAVFVDTQAAFDEVLVHQYAATLAWD